MLTRAPPLPVRVSTTLTNMNNPTLPLLPNAATDSTAPYNISVDSGTNFDVRGIFSFFNNRTGFFPAVIFSIGDETASGRVVNSLNCSILSRGGVDRPRRMRENRPAGRGRFICRGRGGESAVASGVKFLRKLRVITRFAASDDRVGILGGESSEIFAEVERPKCTHVLSLHEKEGENGIEVGN